MYDFFENDGVNVLPKHVEQKPVTHLSFFDDDVDAFFLDESEADEEQIGSHPGRENDNRSVQDHRQSQSAQNEEPEPQKHVNLFVDNVYGQNAEGVVTFDISGSAEFVKSALGHSRKNVNDWIDSIFFVSHRERNDFDAKCEESSV